MLEAERRALIPTVAVKNMAGDRRHLPRRVYWLSIQWSLPLFPIAPGSLVSQIGHSRGCPILAVVLTSEMTSRSSRCSFHAAVIKFVDDLVNSVKHEWLRYIGLKALSIV